MRRINSPSANKASSREREGEQKNNAKKKESTELRLKFILGSPFFFLRLRPLAPEVGLLFRGHYGDRTMNRRE